MATKSNGGSKYVTVGTLSLMTIAAVVSLRGLPMMAAEGFSMIFYLLFATIVFLIPAALVSAELGSAFSQQKGGVFNWVSAALGTRWGFVAVWLQWIQNVVWYPTVLAFAAACLAYLFGKPELASSGVYNGLIILAIYWISSLIALRGFKAVNMVSRFGVIVGTIAPGVLVIILGSIWAISGQDIALIGNETIKAAAATHYHPVWFPHVSGLGTIAFLAGIVLLFAGVEVQAVQVRDMKDPAKQFPLAMLVSAIVIFILFTLGSLAVAIVVPVSQLTQGAGLTSGLMIAFQIMLDKFHLSWLVNVMGLCMAFGAIGGVMSWITGPSRSLLLTAQEGNLPPMLAKTNKNGSPVALIVVQLIIVSLLACLYFIMKDVSAAFYVLSAMTVTLYLGMYMLMFIAAIVLRYKQPNLPRSFKIPGGMFGMWLVAGIGFIGVTFALVVGFFPPSSLTIGSNALYVGLVAAGLIIFVGMPLIIQAVKKPSWLPKVSPDAAPATATAAAATPAPDATVKAPATDAKAPADDTKK